MEFMSIYLRRPHDGTDFGLRLPRNEEINEKLMFNTAILSLEL